MCLVIERIISQKNQQEYTKKTEAIQQMVDTTRSEPAEAVS